MRQHFLSTFFVFSVCGSFFQVLLCLDKFRFIGYAFQIEMKYKIWKKKYKLKEKQIAIELNGTILPKQNYKKKIKNFLIKFQKFF